MTARSRPFAAATLALALAVLSACAATTYEGAASTGATAPAPSAPATDAARTGTAAELLPELADEATGLSRLMIDGGDDDASAARIEALWQAARQQVAATRPELLADFDANVRHSRTAVEFRRAADADKAAANLRALVDAYLG